MSNILCACLFICMYLFMYVSVYVLTSMYYVYNVYGFFIDASVNQFILID